LKWGGEKKLKVKVKSVEIVEKPTRVPVSILCPACGKYEFRVYVTERGNNRCYVLGL